MNKKLQSMNRAWWLLLIVSAASVGTAELMGNRSVAVAVIMAITALKGGIITARFMELRRAPVGVRFYLAAWIAVTATMIATLTYLNPG